MCYNLFALLNMGNLKLAHKHLNPLFQICLLSLLALTFMGKLGGDTQKAEKQKVLQHDAQAILKLVSVRVLDQEGKPVMNLTQEDFILYDNNKSQKITEFEVHKLRVYGKRPADYPGKDVIYRGKRKYFILLDIQGSSIPGAANSKDVALHFVETKLMPEDEACVLSYAPMTGLTMHEYLTPDKEKIKNAIIRAKETRQFPGFWIGSGDDSLRQVGPKGKRGENAGQGGSSNATIGGGLNTIWSPSMGKFGHKTIDFKNCLTDLTKIMQYIPGNKSVLYFSSRSFGREIGRQFASSNTPVFTVNSHKWKNTGALTLREREARKRAEHHLQEFSVASGGQYFPDVKSIETIAATVNNLTANFYVLGYYIDQKWDGKFNKIRIEVKKPEYRIFVQEGYFNPKPFSQFSDIEKSIHLYDLAFSEKPRVLDPFQLPLELLHCADEKQPILMILSRLYLDEKAGIPPGKTELFTFIFDKDHELIESHQGEIDLSTIPQRIVYPYHLASLKPGKYEGRIVGRDMETGQAAVGISKIEIQAPLEIGIRVYSPLLLVPGNEPAFVRMTKEKKQEKSSQSIISYYPLLPLKSSPLIGNMEEGMDRLWAVVPTLLKGIEIPDVEIKILLRRKATGREFELESDILDTKVLAETNMDILLMEILFPKLEPGDYVLEFTAAEFTSMTESIVKIPLIKR